MDPLSPKHIVPQNTALPGTFYETFQISPLHVEPNNNPPLPPPKIAPGHITEIDSTHIPAKPIDSIELFQDFHSDHSVFSNIDLCYEVLYQASSHVPGWKTIPFEIFASIIDIKPITGGLSNILVSVELNEHFLTDKILQASRPQTVQTILQKIHAEIKSNDNITVPVLENPFLLRPLATTTPRPFSTSSPRDSSTTLPDSLFSAASLPNDLSTCSDDYYIVTTDENVVPSESLADLVPLDISSLQTLSEHQSALLSPSLSQNISNDQDDDSIPIFIPVASLRLNQDTIEQLSLLQSEFLYIKPAITKVAVRIYGTSEFANRATELGLAKAAADANVSETIFASWRHGRITSFLTGPSVGSFKWFDPLISSSCAYLQGKLHGTNFLNSFKNTSLPVPSTERDWVNTTLNGWYKKCLRTKLFKQIQTTQPPSVSSIFDMFTDKSNQLYVLNRPATAMKVNDTRVPNVILPLPKQFADVILPLLNGYQLDILEAADASKSHFPYPKRSQRTSSIEDLIAVKNNLIDVSNIKTAQVNLDGDVHAQIAIVGDNTILNNSTIQCDKKRILTQEQSELILQYLDLPRMRGEIDWLLDQCRLFPIVTSHNDFHSLNVILLDQLVEANIKVKTAHSSTDGHVISVDVADINSTLTSSALFPYPSTDLPSQPWPLPNDSIPWLKAIDYEYGGLNFRGYDTGNSHNEVQIVYDGSMPGFSFDIPQWVTTQCVGVYDPSIIELKETCSEQVKDIKYHQCFEHPAINHKQENTHKFYDFDRVEKMIKVWNQREDERIGANIQHVLLGCHAKEAYNIEKNATTPQPAHRPREILWIQSCLTGFYHSCIEQHLASGKLWPQDPIHPFQTTSPSAHPGFLPSYTLPLTLSEWLEEQTPLLLYETMILQFASQMAWVHWGIVYTETATIEGFGYLEHSLARMIAYVAKKEVIEKLGLLNPQLHQNFINKHLNKQ